jgi:hypothetical protein
MIKLVNLRTILTEKVHEKNNTMLKINIKYNLHTND